jgi:hypothetical protein
MSKTYNDRDAWISAKFAKPLTGTALDEAFETLKSSLLMSMTDWVMRSHESAEIVLKPEGMEPVVLTCTWNTKASDDAGA